MEPRYTKHSQENKQLYAGNHLPYNPALVQYARELRKNATHEERKLWKALHEAPFKVLRQRPIDEYIVDFYIAEARLVIELDGGHHFRESGIASDAQRTADLEQLGLHVIRFSNLDIRNNVDGAVQMIVEYVRAYKNNPKSPL